MKPAPHSIWQHSFLKPVLIVFYIAWTGVSFAQSDILHLKSNVTDTIFGKAIKDPYRWMEDLHSDSVKEWLKEQKAVTKQAKAKFKGRYVGAFDDLSAHQMVYVPAVQKEGPYYFLKAFSNNTYQSSPVLYYRKDIKDPQMVACDPRRYYSNKLVSINNYSLSDDAKYLAVVISKGGADWSEIRVRNLDKDKDLSDKIEGVKYSGVEWWQDGFFYSRLANPSGDKLTAVSSGQEMFYHQLGQNPEDDELVMAISDSANVIFRFEKTSDKKHLIIYTASKINRQWCTVIGYKNLEDGVMAELQPIIVSSGKEKSNQRVIDLIDSQFIVMSDFQAPHYRLLSYKMGEVNKATQLVEEYVEVLKEVHHINHSLLGLYFDKGLFKATVFNYDGKLNDVIHFDTGVTISNFIGTVNDSVVMYLENSFYFPAVVRTLNLISKKFDFLDKTRVSYSFDDYRSCIVKYKSKDGTEIPMYLTYKKDLKLKNNNPVLLEGYGGFGLSETPTYSYSNVLFCASNGILAVPLIRGGGEMGEQWHRDGSLLKKQNSFDDFIAAAEYLEKEGYTSKEKLAIEGGSNGGLLVGAVITQRPDLCKVAIGEMGLYDMLRYPKFTGGRYWFGEYGPPSVPEYFDNLLSYSPLHNVKEGIIYPATLLFTAANDDRVPPFHSYKFLATLQEKSSGDNPHILYFEEDAGHNGSIAIDERTEQEAFKLAFIFTQFGLQMHSGN